MWQGRGAVSHHDFVSNDWIFVWCISAIGIVSATPWSANQIGCRKHPCVPGRYDNSPPGSQRHWPPLMAIQLGRAGQLRASLDGISQLTTQSVCLSFHRGNGDARCDVLRRVSAQWLPIRRHRQEEQWPGEHCRQCAATNGVVLTPVRQQQY